MPFMPPNQQRQSTEGKTYRDSVDNANVLVAVSKDMRAVKLSIYEFLLFLTGGVS